MSDSVLVKVNVAAPTPLMHKDAADKFNQLRKIVCDKAGFDFLAKCGDIFRPAGFTSKKDGVANRSWHKTGRAVDVDQSSPHLVIVSEPRGGKQYFRVYLKCAKQDGTLGRKMTVRDKRGFNVSGYLFDFTQAAEFIGFERIPAWNGWQQSYNRQEWWHIQFDEGLTWDEAMLQLRGKNRPPKERVLGLNDRSPDVAKIQQRLSELKFLPQAEVDGIYGAKTKLAVENFQKSKNLDADGLVGPDTGNALFAAK